MKLKEFKNEKLLNVTMVAYTHDLDGYITLLKQAGVENIVVDRGIYLHFVASIKDILRLEELGGFDWKRVNLKIDNLI